MNKNNRNSTANDTSPFSKPRALTLLVCGVLAAPSVYAQAVNSISSDPTRAQQPVPEPSLRKPKSDKEGFVLPKIDAPESIKPGGATITLQSIAFEGYSVFTDAELQEQVAEFLNKPLRVSDLEAIRQKVSQFYIDKGYINSGALLQTQSLAGGSLKLKIIEGRLTHVKQTGQERLREDYLRDRLIDGAGEPLNINELQNRYRLLLADPLVERLNAQLLPGAHPGEAVLDVNVARARPYQLYLGADDYQTPAVGGYTGRMGGWVDNLLTLGERIDAQFIANEGALGYNTGISIPLNAQDTRFTFRYSDNTSKIIEQPFSLLTIKNHIVGFDGGISHPIYRTYADELSLGLNLAVRQNRTLFFGNQCIPLEAVDTCDTQVTVLRMSQHASHKGDSNSLVFWSTFNVGLDALGATVGQTGRQQGQFLSWLGQGMFAQRLWDNGALLVLKGNLQLADKPMLSLERYSLGGVYTVRGYRENSYVRDNGYNTSVELRYPIFDQDTTEKNHLHLVPFLDYGNAWNNGLDQFDKPTTDELFSTGIGFEWQYHQISTEFYWAHAFTPVANRINSNRNIQDDGIHFRVNFNVF